MRRWIGWLLTVALLLTMTPVSSLAETATGGEYGALIEVSRSTVAPNGAFEAKVLVTGKPGAVAPTAAQIRLSYMSSNCRSAEVNPALKQGRATCGGLRCLASYYNYDGKLDANGQLWVATYTISAGEKNDVTMKVLEGLYSRTGNVADLELTLPAEAVVVKVTEDGEDDQVDTTGLNLTSAAWDGKTVDISWYAQNPDQEEYTLTTAAQWAGAAALVNGLVNKDCEVYTGDARYTASEWNNGSFVHSDIGSSGSNNKSTAEYHYGSTRLEGVTLKLGQDLDMTAGNYMPVGGQYLMEKNDSRTKISASFCGSLDGQGHVITIDCDRHCSSGNYGDGQSIGLIGLLGVHDNEANVAPSGCFVRNVEVRGNVSGNRMVGGVVGRVGKTADEAVIEKCVNRAEVTGSDAKGTGGIVGAAWNKAVIRDCYNTGDVSNTSTRPAGGIVGTAEGPVENCYNAGTVTAGSDNYAMAIGTDNGGSTFKNCWYLEGSAAGGGYFVDVAVNSGAMTAAAMKEAAFVTQLGSAFNADSDHINKGYPILKWQGGTPVEQEDVDKSKLKEAVEAAQSDLNGTKVAENGSNVPKTEKWVPQNAADALKEAIGSAQTVADNPDATQDEVDQAVKALQDAVAAFDAAKKDGTKSSGSSGGTTPSSPSDTQKDRVITVADAAHGSASTPKSAKAGETVTITAAPEEGFTVDQVTVKDADCRPVDVKDLGGGKYSYIQPKSDVTVDVSFKAVEPGPEDHEAACPSKAFRDLDTSLWYHEAIDYVLNHNYFNGVGDALFEPDGTMTRAMFVTVLGRVNGVDVSQYQNTPFADVPAGQWYTAYVAWASEHGIVLGYDSESFGPDDSITREQMAAILYRYAKYAGEDVTAVDASRFRGFRDAEQVSEYARAPMIWATAKGLINGMGDGTLAPQETATRAQVAQLIMNFDKFIG